MGRQRPGLWVFKPGDPREWKGTGGPLTVRRPQGWRGRQRGTPPEKQTEAEWRRTEFQPLGVDTGQEEGRGLRLPGAA